jgi:hypothetical protein
LAVNNLLLSAAILLDRPRKAGRLDRAGGKDQLFGDGAPTEGKLSEECAMVRLLVSAALAGFALAAVAPQALAQKKVVESTKKWSGSVDDGKAIQPECITSAKGLEAVWKAWKIAGDVPTVDFTKDMVVAVYSAGSKLDMAEPKLDDKGNLEVLGFGTRDLRPGFRYVLGVVSREGVKTVNKKELPKE